MSASYYIPGSADIESLIKGRSLAGRKNAQAGKASTAKANKYNAKKKEVDGQVFDSAHEAERYAELRILERAGKVSGIRTQVKYELIPEQREPDYVDEKGRKRKGRMIERPVSYIADFVYKDEETGETVVEDAKSPATRTRAYTIKRKLMLYRYGIRIREV